MVEDSASFKADCEESDGALDAIVEIRGLALGLSDTGDSMTMGVDGGASTVSGGDPAGGDSRNCETRRRIDLVLAGGGLRGVLDCTEPLSKLSPVVVMMKQGGRQL